MPKDMHSNISQLFNNKSKQKKTLIFLVQFLQPWMGVGGLNEGSS